MIRKYTLELITVIAVLAFIVIFLYVSAGGSHEFSGSDDVGSQKIAELTGKTVESFTPLIPPYEPPGGEIESTLFALQASFGGLILGFVFGYWLGQRKSLSTTRDL
jgi:cobalt/nickel transport protein